MQLAIIIPLLAVLIVIISVILLRVSFCQLVEARRNYKRLSHCYHRKKRQKESRGRAYVGVRQLLHNVQEDNRRMSKTIDSQIDEISYKNRKINELKERIEEYEKSLWFKL